MSDSKIDPRLTKIIKLQTVAIFFNAVIAVIVGVGAANVFFPDSPWSFLVGLAIAWGCSRVLNWLTLVCLQLTFYGFNLGELEKNTEAAVSALHETQIETKNEICKMPVKIVDHPEKPVGRFMDTEFYEWIVVANESGKTYRFSFLGTHDMSKGLPEKMPEGQILLPPGLYYQVDTPVNTST